MKEPKKTMDIILIILAVFLILFVIVMLVMFYLKDAIPDTLCTCVFAICGGECGVMGWIKTTKERYRDRQFELEDRQAEKEAEAKIRNNPDTDPITERHGINKEMEDENL